MRLLLLTLTLLSSGWASIWISPVPSNLPVDYHDYESVDEANGHVVTYGDSTYGTSIRLDTAKVHNKFFSVVGFVLRQNDTDNQSSHGYLPHRAYVYIIFFGYPLTGAFADTTKFVGLKMLCPCYVEFEYLEVGINLHGHGHGHIDDWESPATLTADSTHINAFPITLGRDSNNYIYIEHAPAFDTTTHIYQASPSNDPTGMLAVKPNRWHLIQWYYDPTAYGDSSGYSKVWVDFNLHSYNLVRHQPNFISAFHLGLYCSAAVTSGSVYNDRSFVLRVKNEKDMYATFFAGRRLGMNGDYNKWLEPNPFQYRWQLWPLQQQKLSLKLKPIKRR